MPQKLDKKFDNGVHLFIWELTETLEQLQNLVNFTVEDVASFSKSEQRFREYLGSRLCLQWALLQVGEGHAIAVKDACGKPQLVGSDWQMSISHAADFVGVCLHPYLPVGLDIERPSEKIRKVVPRLFTATEQAWMRDDLVRMTWGWSAKEALYKLYGKREVDFKEHLATYFTPSNEFQGRISLPSHRSFHQFTIVPLADYYAVVAV